MLGHKINNSLAEKWVPWSETVGAGLPVTSVTEGPQAAPPTPTILVSPPPAAIPIPASKGSSAGAIAGGIAGGVVALALAGGRPLGSPFHGRQDHTLPCLAG